jgi:polysaccharide chain length determinant protein (PEP-CTERM system associated)
MSEFTQTLVATVHGAWRFRWQSLLIAWAGACVGWAVVWSMPSTYTAKAEVYVDRDTVLRPLLQGITVGTDVSNDVRAVQSALLSGPNLERVARETGLASRPKTAEEHDRMINGLARKVSLAASGDGIYTITYSDKDRLMARRVVSTLLNAFVQDSLGLKNADSSSAQQFLLAQIKDYEGRLRTAEEKLAEFKRTNVGQMPGQQGDYYTRLQTSLEQLETLHAKQKELEDRRNEIARQIEGEEPTFGIVASNSTTGPAGPYDAKIAELTAKLEQLRIEYTDKHPEVIATAETIARLKEEQKKVVPKAAVASALADPDPGKRALATLDMNPVYQNMKIALSQADADLAQMRGQAATLEATVAKLRGRVDTIPQVEAQLAQLNRDYEVNRAQYTQLVQRLESARISQQADQSTDKVKFRVVQPPSVPLNPSSPNRPMLVTIIFLSSLGASLAVGYVMAQLKPAFASREQFERITGIPVISSISRAAPGVPLAWFRREYALISGGVGLLVVAFLANVLVASK